MKRFWLVMLSLGLVLAFSAQAFAVDVKFSGDFTIAGMYLDKTTVLKDTGADGPSTAFYYQRLRLQTDFIVSPGLKLVTRLDAMERIWGGARTAATTAALPVEQSAGTQAENQNIAFDHAYIQYSSPIGTFKVGYMDDLVWGTAFNDSALPRGVLAWNKEIGPWNFIVKVIKATDNSYTAINTTATNADLDNDKYAAAVKYTWTSGEAGLLAAMYRNATQRNTGVPANDYLGQFYGLLPYAKAQIGPVKVQAELYYLWGDLNKYESAVGKDVKMSNLGVFVDAVADFGMVYGGGTFAYISGDNPDTTDKQEGSSPLVNGGLDWNPCLIMFNQDITYWAGAIPGYDPTSNSSPMNNAWFGQGRVGVKPIPALDIMASLSYAKADQIPTTVLEKAYGWEIDVTGTYKITNNLSYMLGGAYLFTGDYYKGTTTNDVKDNFLIINKLTLTF